MLRKLERKGGKPYSLRIPVDLHDKLNRLKLEAKLLGYEFTLNGDIINAIEKIVNETEAKLDAIEKRKP